MKKIMAVLMSAVLLASSVTAFGAVRDSSKHWASEFINDAEAEGWLDSKADNNFYPNNYATRQEVAYMVYASQLNKESKLDTTALTEVDTVFKDSDEINSKYKTAMECLYANGLIKGYEDDTFKPNGSITRAETATIISQIIADYPLDAIFYGFKDTVPQWAKINVERCARAGIITGYEDNTFKASNNVTRAEIVAMIYKLNEFNQKAIKANQKQETTTVKITTTEATTELTTVTTTEETTETTTVTVDIAKAQELLQSINNERSENSINSLELDDTLNEIAMLKAIEMAEKNVDDTMSGTYGSLDKMLSERNVKYIGSIEFNVVGVSTGEDVIASLEMTPEKYDIMMTANYEKAGIGYCNGRWSVVYIRQ